MNVSAQMVPGLTALLVGAVLTFFAGKMCIRDSTDTPER